MTTKKNARSELGDSENGQQANKLNFTNQYSRKLPSLSSIKKLDRYLSRMESAKDLAAYLKAFTRFLKTIEVSK